MTDTKCPFCGEPAIRTSLNGTRFRCGTMGPDINGEYSTGHTCDITTWSRVLAEKDEEIERLRQERDAAQNELEKLKQSNQDFHDHWDKVAGVNGPLEAKAEIERLRGYWMEPRPRNEQTDLIETYQVIQAKQEIERLRAELALSYLTPEEREFIRLRRTLAKHVEQIYGDSEEQQ